MPEIDHPVGTAALKSRAVDNIGFVVDNRLDQGRILFGIVFQVGILHHNYVAGGSLEAGLESEAFTEILWLVDNPINFSFKSFLK